MRGHRRRPRARAPRAAQGRIGGRCADAPTQLSGLGNPGSVNPFPIRFLGFGALFARCSQRAERAPSASRNSLRSAQRPWLLPAVLAVCFRSVLRLGWSCFGLFSVPCSQGRSVNRINGLNDGAHLRALLSGTTEPSFVDRSKCQHSSTGGIPVNAHNCPPWVPAAEFQDSVRGVVSIGAWNKARGGVVATGGRPRGVLISAAFPPP